ncbi:hypothetical protein JW848_03555 [Candidatus Bipolaricaulota bacterium]|nr:hypothetical protein [Candidatus Bipolaricaulota bacterium]
MRRSGDETRISCELLVAYAGEDLRRWREVLGCRTWSWDARRGIGRLLDVRWSTHGAGVPPHIQVCTFYERGLTSWIRGAAFSKVHSEIGVSPELGEMLGKAARAWDETGRNVILDQWASKRRQAEDACQLRRIRKMQEAVHRQNSGAKNMSCRGRKAT